MSYGLKPIPICVLFIFLIGSSYGQIEFTEHTVITNFNGARAVFTIDLDGDEDMDILGAADVDNSICWWENDGNQDFEEHNVTEEFNGAYAVHAADMDGDDDIDILGAAYLIDRISWWENDGDQNFTVHIITSNLDVACTVFAADINGDENMDVIGSGRAAHTIAWWENDGNEDFEQHNITTNNQDPWNINIADINDDGAVDVLYVDYIQSDIGWFENDGDGDFTQNVIDNNFGGARWIHGRDMDLDGDIDILSAGRTADLISWWENDGDDEFTEHTVSDNFDAPNCIFAADLDGDGGLDILATAYESNDLAWWINDHPDFEEEMIESNFNGACNVYADDIDGDGDIDVIAAANSGDDITWWENDLDRNPIVAPSNLQAELDVSPGVVLLTWEYDEQNEVDEFIEFIIYRDNEEIGISDELFYNDTLEFNGTYFYSVTALYDEGESASAGPVEIFWDSTWPPYGLEVVINQIFGEVTLSWSHENEDLNDFLTFIIYRDSLQIDSTTELTYADSLEENGTYVYMIDALFDEGMSHPPAGPVTVEFSRILPPHSLKADLDSVTGTVTLQWWNLEPFELIYDHDQPSGYTRSPDATLATHMSPDLPCQILSIKYYLSTRSPGGRFNAEIFGWDENSPGIESNFNRMITGLNIDTPDWLEIDLTGEDIFFETDFVVGFGSVDALTNIGFDDRRDNDRSWDFRDNQWSRWRETYFIRAVVLYPGDQEVELYPSGDTNLLGELDDLIQYNIYQNGDEIGQTDSMTYSIQFEEPGVYTFEVAGLFDEGETPRSNLIEVSWLGYGVENSRRNQNPEIWGVSNAYPNPFNAFTVLKVSTPVRSDLRLIVYNILGNEIFKITKRNLPAGFHNYKLDMNGFASGIYFVKVDMSNKFSNLQKIMLIK
ncbi:MAG: FG-GAP-like repeat-containing protein [Candidatus Electryonea clarkiae]|nr:FG-GAP-like repeat-containing protein [Candidatus Electryonea clarkiae]MDP8286165.1 FG-GAP-like repeat-containing protein [Candidatus Electryonea clarkiae]